MAGESCNLDKEEAELLKAPSTSSPSSASPTPPAAAATAPSPPPHFLKSPAQRTPGAPAAEPGAAACGREESHQKEEAPPRGLSVTRCPSCRKRVGLTGFRCRCGVLFCARHRHADAHDCSFDYKTAGREEISRANPMIRAAKIIKI